MNRRGLWWLGLAVVVGLAAGLALRQTQGPSAAVASVTPYAAERAACASGGAVAPGNEGLLDDCAVLLAARDALRGTAALDWDPGVAIGNWEGITLGGTPERVTRVEVRDTGLDGTVPAALDGLEELTRLVLSDNALTGAIPAELGSLSKLSWLDLSENALTGAIPAELLSLGQLYLLSLDGNGLTGAIPEALFGLAGLGYVDLSENALTGPVPPVPDGRAEMQGIALDDNQLSGTLPVGLGELSLSLLELSGNQFTGCIPQGLRDATVHDLDDLGLSDCTTTTTYALTTSAGPNGRVSPPPGRYLYLDGSSVTVTATPNYGYEIALWSRACAPSITSETCTLAMSRDRAAHPVFKPKLYRLRVTKTGGGSVTPGGATWHQEGTEVTVTASWDDATHDFGWGGACAGTAGSACVVLMDAQKDATATFTELPATRCAQPTASDCIRAVYRGAPGDYAQVVDIPAAVLLATDAAGRYYAGRGEQVTVVTAAPLPSGWTRFWLARTPVDGTTPPTSLEQLIQPVGTTYTFTPTEDEAGATLLTFDLTAARPHPVRPTHKPELGDVVVTTAFQAVSCASGIAVPDPDSNAGLVEDCEHLLALRDTLEGTGALNWSAGRAMSSWDGVTLSGTPQRVTGLSLAGSGLTGELSGLLGALTALTELRLNDNSLTGTIPSRWSQLTDLTDLYLAGNAFTGCVPPELLAVANNDIATLRLPDCGTPTEIGEGEHTLEGGTYTYTARVPGLPQVTFDVPAGVQLEISHLSIGAPTAGHPESVIGLHLEDAAGTSRLCLEVQDAYECGRLETGAGTPAIGLVFDRLIESAWTRAGGASTTLKPWLARNLIVGESIVVCPRIGLHRYQKAAEHAAEKWTSGLRAGPSGAAYIGAAHTVFEIASVCPAQTNSDTIDYVQVWGEPEWAGYFCGKDKYDNYILGCFSPTSTSYSGPPHYTYRNGLHIVVNATYFPPENDHNDQANRYHGLRWIIAHELGHALGLGHVQVPGGGCVSAVMSCYGGDKALYDLQQDDFDLYAAVYRPNPVQPQMPLPYLSTAPGTDPDAPDTLRFSFSGRNTIAEKRIEIREELDNLDGSTSWGPVLLHSSDGAADSETWRLTLPSTPTRGQALTYGIFTTTDAYLEGQPRIVETPIGFPLRVSLLVGADPPPELPPPPASDLLEPPELSAFTRSGVQVAGTYTWTGAAPIFLNWELQSESAEGEYHTVRPPIVDSGGVVTFGPLSPGWYRLRGQACQYSRHLPERPDLRQFRGQFLVCGDWGAYSARAYVQPPPEPAPLVYYRLTVYAYGGGVVSGGGRYLDGTTVRVTAEDTDEWWFNRWEVFATRSPRAVTSTERSVDYATRAVHELFVVMDEDKTVNAHFDYYCDVIGCRDDGGGGDGGPPAPTGAGVSLASETFTVSWDATTGADRYRVRYRNDPEGDWTRLADADPTDTSVTWSPASIACGATYTFQVEARGDGETHTAEWGRAATLGVATTGCELQPTFGSSEYAFSVAGGAEVGTSVGTVAATPGGGLSYSITGGNAAGAFAVGAASGEITVAGVLDSSAASTHTLTVRASDGRGGVTTATATVTVAE